MSCMNCLTQYRCVGCCKLASLECPGHLFSFVLAASKLPKCLLQQTKQKRKLPGVIQTALCPDCADVFFCLSGKQTQLTSELYRGLETVKIPVFSGAGKL